MSKLFVVSAPSGTGKTTLNNRLMKEFPSVEIAVSHTTRPIRDGEVNGRSYHFVDKETFRTMAKSGQMLEWAEVFGNLYGTSKQELDRIFAKGHDVLLEIDVQGCRSILREKPDAVTVFILPPAIETLWKRLEQRGTDKLADRWRRLLTAKQEIEACHIYSHFIVNDNVERAYSELKSIIVDDGVPSLSHNDGKRFCEKLIDEFRTSELLQDLKKKLG
jgi:guanylate kinase